ncbi:GGDEF domain-containing protein [Clostridia bacterium]|nr:GGDEF domain-containing protein [Clostridia bacterium]
MSLFLLISVMLSMFISLVLGIYVLFFSKSGCKPQFTLFSAGVVSYMLGVILEMTAESASGAMNGAVMQYIGTMTASIMLTFFVLAFVQIRVPRILIGFMIVVGASVVALVATTVQTKLFYSFITFYPEKRVAEIGYGPTYMIGRAFAMFCLVVILIAVIKTIWKQKRFSHQLILLTAASILPPIADIICLSVFHLGSIGVNPSVFTMLIMALLLFIAITKFNLLDISSVAMAQALNSISDAYILLDTNRNYMGANSAALKLFPELSSMDKQKSITDIERFPKVLAELNPHESLQNLVFSISENDNDCRYYRADTTKRISKKGETIGVIVLIHDITESVKLTEQLEIAAHRDALTGLYSRLHFMELSELLIKKIERTNKKFYILMTDLDFFKKVNDNYGHLAGDAVLKKTARIAMNAVLPYGVFGRYGGEEFILFVNESDENKVLAIAEKLRAEIEANPVDYEDLQIKVTVSIGVSCSVVGKNKNDETIEDVIKRADEALYRAKEDGRNRVVVNAL